MQSIAWKDSCPQWPIMCRVWHQTLLTQLNLFDQPIDYARSKVIRNVSFCCQYFLSVSLCMHEVFETAKHTTHKNHFVFVIVYGTVMDIFSRCSLVVLFSRDLAMSTPALVWQRCDHFSALSTVTDCVPICYSDFCIFSRSSSRFLFNSLYNCHFCPFGRLNCLSERHVRA